jgi:hypothetical protein
MIPKSSLHAFGAEAQIAGIRHGHPKPIPHTAGSDLDQQLVHAGLERDIDLELPLERRAAMRLDIINPYFSKSDI